MWICENCKEIFDEPDYESICAEDYYGVSSMFNSCNYIDIKVCPECGSDEIEEYYDEED